MLNPVLTKKFECGALVWRLVAEGNIVRVDLWRNRDWEVFAQGIVARGEIKTLAPIFSGTNLPARLLSDANAALLLMAPEGQRTAAGVDELLSRKRFECDGAYKRAARRLGISLEKYTQYRLAGESWCAAGKHWATRVSAGGRCLGGCPKAAQSEQAARAGRNGVVQ
jgi:hypothetical protein